MQSPPCWGREGLPVWCEVQRHLLRLVIIIQYDVLVCLLVEACDCPSVVHVVALPPHLNALPKVLQPIRLAVHCATACGGAAHTPAPTRPLHHYTNSQQGKAGVVYTM